MRLTFVLASAAPAPLPAAAQDDEIAAQCARALAKRGHEVSVAAVGAPPAWFSAPLRFVDLLAAGRGLPRQDLLLTASCGSIPAARSLRAGPVSHLCHRFEGDLASSDRAAEAIDRAYSLVVAGLATSPRLARFLEHRYGRTSHIVTLPLDEVWRPAVRLGPRRDPRVVVAGTLEDAGGLQVVVELARRLISGESVPTQPGLMVVAPGFAPREATEPTESTEPGGEARAPVGVAPSALRRFDLALLAQHASVLRLLQCAASGVPLAILDGGAGADLARRVGLGAIAADGERLALQAEALLRSGVAWRSARREGIAMARKHRDPEVVAQLERAVGELARGLD